VHAAAAGGDAAAAGAALGDAERALAASPAETGAADRAALALHLAALRRVLAPAPAGASVGRPV
jgi:hypothetical protein